MNRTTYLLFIQDLLKRTPENHPDYGNLSKAFAKMVGNSQKLFCSFTECGEPGPPPGSS